MSAPAYPQVVPSLLPPGWTEHIGISSSPGLLFLLHCSPLSAPGGQPYYFNSQTRESTYIRPLPTFPFHPVAPPQPVAPKKEKPLTKTPIQGTEWLRVKTTAGNIFYSNKVTKESVWTVPSEIRQLVESLESSERESNQNHIQDGSRVSATEEENLAEIQRVKDEVEATLKRKVEDVVPLDEVVISKRTKLGSTGRGMGDAGDGEDDGEDSDDESEEEEWQREAAAQLAAEAEEEQKRQEQENERIQQEAEAQKVKETQPHNMPERVDLSLDEAKALFKVRLWISYEHPPSLSKCYAMQTLLREKDINPLHPWDNALPLFVSDPRYVLLPSVSARREAFDEYCRDRARELRQAAVKKEKEASNPKEEFDRLLREEVKSTRTTWNEFRREWKKERRFWGWGRDDREREKRFKEYIKELRESEHVIVDDLLTISTCSQKNTKLPKRLRETSSLC